MAKLNRTKLLSCVYRDPKNFPYGFSRSGDFTISEAKTLEAYGTLINALSNASIAPENEEDSNFLAVINGEKPPVSAPEKVWLKYIKLINRQRAGSIYGGSRFDTEEVATETLNDHNSIDHNSIDHDINSVSDLDAVETEEHSS